MSTETSFYARFDNVSSNEWEYFADIQHADDLTGLNQLWSEDPGYSEDEKHSAFRSIIGDQGRDPRSLREWVIRLRALIMLVEVSPRAVTDYLVSEAGKQFSMSVDALCMEVFGEEMGGKVGRRTIALVDSFVLDIPLGELEAGDTRNLREVLLNVEALDDDLDNAALMQRVSLSVEGASPASSELRASVSAFCKEAADVYTWLYLLNFNAPGTVEVIAEYWEDTVSDMAQDEDPDDDDVASDPSLADQVEVVIEHALLDEYDEYAARYSLGLDRWEDWCQEALAFLQRLRTGTRRSSKHSEMSDGTHAPGPSGFLP